MGGGLIILLGVALLLIVVIGTFVLAYILTHPPRRTVGVVVAQGLPTDPLEAGAAGYTTRLLAIDGGEIEMWEVAGADKKGPAIVMLHGWGDSRLGELLWLDVLLPVASRVILFDIRAHGESKFRSCTWGVREVGDVATIIDVVGSAAPTGNSHHESAVVLFGYSMGAAIAIEAAAACGQRVAAVIADSPYRTIAQAVRGTMRLQGLPTWPVVGLAMCWLRWRGQAPGGQDLARTAARIECPLLVLHGAEDRVTHVGDAKQIASAARQGELRKFESCDHLEAGCAEREGYVEAVKSFLEEHIPPRMDEPLTKREGWSK